MARIEPLAPEEIEPSLKPVIAEAEQRLPQFINQILTLAHHPRIAHDLVTMYLGFQEETTVERRLIELAILAVSHLNRCTYCVSHHSPLAQRFGVSEEALGDLEQGRIDDSPHFSAQEKLVIAYAVQVTQDARRVPRSLFAQLRSEFTESQLVELTVRIGLANFFNRLNDAFQIDLEPGVAPLPIAGLEYGVDDAE